MVCRLFNSLLFKTFDHFFLHLFLLFPTGVSVSKNRNDQFLQLGLQLLQGEAFHVKKNKAIFASVNLYAFFRAESLPVA